VVYETFIRDDGTPALVHLAEVPPLYGLNPRSLRAASRRSNDLGLNYVSPLAG